MRVARVCHDAGHVGKVKVDKAGNIDEVGNALHTVAQNIVGNAERIGERNFRIGNLLETLVRNDNKRIDKLRKFCNPRLCLRHPLASLKHERFGHDTDGQNIHLSCNPRQYGSCARSGAAAHSRRDKDHISPLQQRADLLNGFFRRTRADRRVCACAEALRDLLADHKLIGCLRLAERLTVSIHGYEADPLDVCGDHAVHGIVSAAADTDNLDIHTALEAIVVFKGHVFFLPDFCFSHPALLERDVPSAFFASRRVLLNLLI